jgi:hypothetical protein
MKAHYEKTFFAQNVCCETPKGETAWLCNTGLKVTCPATCVRDIVNPKSLSFLRVLSGKEHVYEGHVVCAGDIVWLATPLLISCYQFSQNACEATRDVAPCLDLRPCL